MPKVIITPWRDESELLDVRSKFYPSSSTNSTSSTDERPDACRIVEAWKLRGHLPHAVEATALLTDAILHDNSTHNSVFSIRATYAAAFSRFVTGLVDTKLGGNVGGTMFNRASMIGLPLSFVELRHEAAHRELPSLVLLRSYTNRALEWLWDYYWVRIDQGSLSTVNIGEDGLRGRVKGLLQQFWQQVESDNSRKRVKSLTTSVSQSLVSICKSESLEGVKVVCRVFLEDGFIVPENRQLETSMESLFATWDPVLQSITDSVKTFSTILTEEMAKELSNRPNTPATTENAYLEGVYLWLEHIITSKTWTQHKLFLCSMPYLRFVCEEWFNHWTGLLVKIIALEIGTSQVYDSASTKPVLALDDHVQPALDDLQPSGWSF